MSKNENSFGLGKLTGILPEPGAGPDFLVNHLDRVRQADSSAKKTALLNDPHFHLAYNQFRKAENMPSFGECTEDGILLARELFLTKATDLDLEVPNDLEKFVEALAKRVGQLVPVKVDDRRPSQMKIEAVEQALALIALEPDKQHHIEAIFTKNGTDSRRSVEMFMELLGRRRVEDREKKSIKIFKRHVSSVARMDIDFFAHSVLMPLVSYGHGSLALEALERSEGLLVQRPAECLKFLSKLLQCLAGDVSSKREELEACFRFLEKHHEALVKHNPIEFSWLLHAFLGNRMLDNMGMHDDDVEPILINGSGKVIDLLKLCEASIFDVENEPYQTIDGRKQLIVTFNERKLKYGEDLIQKYGEDFPSEWFKKVLS